MLSEADRAENWSYVVDEAVALQAILGNEFWIETGSKDVIGLETLTQESSETSWSLQQEELSLCALVRPTIPEAGLSLQIEKGIDSGSRVSHLPPLRLSLRLSEAYPSLALPGIVVTAVWLSHTQEEALLHSLQQEAESYLGGPVSYALISWLENQALASLGSTDTLLVQPGLQCRASQQRNGSAAPNDPEVRTVGRGSEGHDSRVDLLQMLLQYNASTELHNFQAGVWSCPICFEEHPGTAVIRLAPCSHHFCIACLVTHAKTQLKDSRADMLLCPQADCKNRLSRQQLQHVLGKDDNQVWEDLEIQSALLTMQDVIFCPRCSTVCIEDADHTAICSRCHFAFCSLCQGAYHPGKKCMTLETKLKILEERKRGLSKEQGQKAADEIRRKEEELLSLVALEKSAKECPACGSHISRTEGCNKMRCTACGTAFCWTCLAVISGYDHFRAGGCLVFDDATVAELQAQNRYDAHAAMEFNAALAREGDEEGQIPFHRQNRARTCPFCGQWNYKQGNLNSMTCWSCGGRYCYLCRHRIRKGEGGLHFRPTGCKQHSAD